MYSGKIYINQKKKTNTTNNEAEDSVYNDFLSLRDSKQSIFKDFERFPGTLRIEDDDISLTLENYKCNFFTYETPRRINEVNDIDNTSQNSVKANVSCRLYHNEITIKSQIHYDLMKSHF